MTLREAEKAVLEAALVWDEHGSGRAGEVELARAVKAYRRVKSAGKPKARCYCGKTVSIEGDHLRGHRQAGGIWHAPLVADLDAEGGEVKDAAW